MNHRFSFFTCVLCAASLTCFAQPRLIGMQVDQAENANYDSAITWARGAGMVYVHLPVNWKELESAPGVFDGPAREQLATMDLYYPAANVPLEVNISVINTVQREVPQDLMTASFSSPAMIARFTRALDTILGSIPHVTLVALTIGNESDGVFGSDTSEIGRFKVFLDSARAHAKAAYARTHSSQLRVGTTLGFGGVTGTAMRAQLRSLNAGMDIIAVTYYGIRDDFTVKSPATVEADIDTLMALYPGRTVMLTECGYPSSTACGSSEEMQRQFIAHVFTAWDRYPTNLLGITFFSLTDWPATTVDVLAQYYGLPNHAAFKGYLGSLGLRRYPGNGSSKPAYGQLVAEARSRGFLAVRGGVAGPRTFSHQRSKGGFGLCIVKDANTAVRIVAGSRTVRTHVTVLGQRTAGTDSFR